MIAAFLMINSGSLPPRPPHPLRSPLQRTTPIKRRPRLRPGAHPEPSTA